MVTICLTVNEVTIWKTLEWKKTYKLDDCENETGSS